MTPSLNRRDFIKASTATAVLVGLGLSDTKVFGAAAETNDLGTIPTVTLNNGVKMPLLGFGTMMLNGPAGLRSMTEALALGYRLIDTATIYNTEIEVGQAIRQSGLKRDELFVTSKLWKTDMGYENTKKGFQTSLDKMKLDYLDLYLIHRPSGGDWKGSWKAMEELHSEGKIKALGMSNATVEQISELLATFTVKPAVHQIETHAFFQESTAFELLKKQGIQMEAWAPFAEGRNHLFTHPALVEIAAKHQRTVAQVCLRWHLQRGVVAIPRSLKKAHLEENRKVFDFTLDAADLRQIAALDLGVTQFPEWS